ncbi:hypothetical protein AB0G06_03595 [Nonomuraea dietziae]|uniref:hypothetical protein n=1 Tax=Nonomuraea dietziae TaxID=65515 RepID=UPI003400E551
MATYTSPVRAPIDDAGSEELPLDMLREALKNAKPALVRGAAEEFAAIGVKLGTMIEILDKHLAALDKAWTAGEDAKQVKAQLRRLRDSAASVKLAISDGDESRCATKGIAPALAAYSDTLNAFRGDNVPDKAGSDISTLEAAGQWGMGGAGIGLMVGGPPGAVIGGVVGTIAGGITSLFSDVPFLNLVGESKQEKEQKAAKEHLRKLTDATIRVNGLFPPSLTTDIPQLTVPSVKVKDINAPGGTGSGGMPDLSTKAYDPTLGKGPDGLDGLRGSGLDGVGDRDLDGGLDGSGLGGRGDLDGRTPDGSGLGGGRGDQGGDGLDDRIKGVGPGPGAPDLDPGSVDGSPPPDVPGGNGTGFDGKGANTSLAGYDRDLSQVGTGRTPFDGTGTSGNSGNTGTSVNTGSSSVGTGGGGGGGAGAVPVSSAGSRTSANGGMSGFCPPPAPSGSKSDEEESERNTWLLEDDDVFTSDARVTIHRIDDVSKDRT